MRVAPTDAADGVDNDVGMVDLDEAERIVAPSTVGAAGSETLPSSARAPPPADDRDSAAAAAVAQMVAPAAPDARSAHGDGEDSFFRNRRKSIDHMFTGDGADGVHRASGAATSLAPFAMAKAGEQPGLTPHETPLHTPAFKPDAARLGVEKMGALGSASARSSISAMPVQYDSLGPAALSWRHRLNMLLDHAAWAWLITVLTVWALIADDMRLALCPKSVDEGFFAVTFVCLVIFSLEIAVQWLVRPEYRFSFYFGLDAVATISLLPDVGWLWDLIMDQSNDDDAIGLSGGGDHDHDSALRAGRASRAGTRAARIIRIIRLVRVVRILKLYKVKQKKEGFPGDRALFDEDTDLEHFNAERKAREEPSNVGKKLTDLTTRRVILITLLLVIVNPFFSGALEEDTHAYQESGLERLHHYPQDYNYSGSVDETLFRTEVREWARNTGKLLYLDICGHGSACRTTWPVETVTEWLRTLKFQPSGDPSGPYDQNRSALTGWSPSQTLLSDAQLVNWQDELRRDLRKSEMTRYRVFGCFARNGSVARLVSGQTCVSLAVFDNREVTTFDAGINTVKTVFIMLVLIGAMFFFSRDAQVLVIEPIERMMRLVKDLAANPLATIDEGLERDLTEQEMEAHEEGYETVLLEQSLSKIGGLLQVGFGVAGTEIIGKNMKAAGALNVMLPGKKITTVIGFGAIEEFTDSCTCLEEKICMYINTIAKIVHSDTHAYYGAANKNTGSAFLLCWKICDGMLPGLRDPRDPQRGSTVGLRRRGSTHKSSAVLGEADMAADLNFKERARDGVFNTGTGAGLKTRNIVPMEMVESALCAFLKIQIDLHHANNRSLLEFTQADGILRRFGTGYRVSMTFGMHIGWAVEGAIGSRFKIDASYLSPNVNLAARLQAATSQLGVGLLLSEWFVDELGPQARNMCRRIDRVTVKGSETPMNLYTWDILNFPDHRVLVPKFDNQGRQRPVNFGVNPEFRDLQDGIEPAFLSLHKAGLESYLAGRWEEASEKFEAALRAHHTGTDGPTQYVLDFMRSHDLKPPGDWNGYRRLMKKHHAYERFRDAGHQRA